MQKNKKILRILTLIGIFAFMVFTLGKSVSVFGDTVDTLDQWKASSSPRAITQRVFGKPLLLTGLNTGECLTLASNGIATTTGAACGAGGGGAFTIGSGLIYNSTSTDLVGIGTSSPTTTFFIQGKGGTNPFAVASSTGTQMLTLLQNGNFGISTSSPIASFSLTGRSGTNPFVIASSTGTQLLTLLQSGNFGISTSSPLAKLSVVGDTSSVGSAPSAISAYGGTGAMSGSGGGFLFTGGVGGSSNGAGGAFTVVGGTGGANGMGGSLSFTGGTGGTGGSGGSITLAGGSTGGSGTGGNIYVYGGTPAGGSVGNVVLGLTAGSVQMGNVGVGSSTPSARLSVVGSSSSAGNIFDVASSSNTSFFRVTSAGLVGIGTTSPSDTLSVTGGLNLTGAFKANGNPGTSGMVLQTTGSVTQWVATSSLGLVSSAFTVGSGLIYNATSTDLVGIGTTSPTTTLFVQGKGGTNPFSIASSTGTNLLTFTQTGRLGIGTASPSYPLHVVGNGYVTSILGVGGAPSGSYNFEVTGSSNFTSTTYFRGITYHFNGTNNYFGMQAIGTVNKITTTAASTNKDIVIQPGDVTSATFAFGGNVGIGSTTPGSLLSIKGTSGSSTPLFTVASSTNDVLFTVGPGGHLITGGGTPAVSTCGTSPSISGNDTAGTVTVGTGVVVECTITFARTRLNTPKVVGVVTGGGLNIAGGYSAKSTTAVTFSFAATVAGGTFDYYIVE